MKQPSRLDIQACVASAVVGRPNSCTIDTLRNFDQDIQIRGFAGFAHTLKSAWGDSSWNALRPGEITKAVPQAALRFLTCHANGRIREAAVRLLDEQPANLRWLLLRTNDWYAPLAQLASEKATLALRVDNCREHLSYLVLLEGFSQPVVSLLLRRLHQICFENPEVFESFTFSTAALPASRRRAWEYLFQAHPQRALQAAQTNPDAVIRARLLKHSPSLEQILALFRDPVPFLRRDALQRLGHEGSLSDDILSQALLDRAVCVRDLAKFYAKKLSKEALLQSVYRKAALSPGRLEGAVGVLPVEELEPILSQSLEHSNRAIVKAAMSALDRISPEAEYLWWKILRSDEDRIKRLWAGRLLKARRSFYLTYERLQRAQEQVTPLISEELQSWAERSHCPYTRLTALYQRVKDSPNSLSQGEFSSHIRSTMGALPPYSLPPDFIRQLESLVSAWPPDWQEFLRFLQRSGKAPY